MPVTKKIKICKTSLISFWRRQGLLANYFQIEQKKLQEAKVREEIAREEERTVEIIKQKEDNILKS